MSYKFNSFYCFLVLVLDLFILISSCRTTEFRVKYGQTKTNAKYTFKVDSSVKKFINVIIVGTEDDRTSIYKNSLRMKSSNMRVVEIRNDVLIGVWDNLKCSATLQEDTLNIHNFFNTGHSGINVSIIFIKHKTISIEIHRSYDFPTKNIETKFFLKKFYFALDKSKYALQDSLFGSVSAKVIDSKKVSYYLTGFFKTQIAIR